MADTSNPMFSDSFASKLMAGMGGGSALAGLMGMFGVGQNNPYDQASPFYNQIPGMLKQYMQPYVNNGLNAMNTLNGTYSNLLNDPGSVLANIGKGFKTSPGYQFQLNQGENSINNAAAAGGMLGSPQHQYQSGQLATNLANQNFNTYLQNAMGLYNRGLSGEEGMNQMGFNASEDMANNLSRVLQAQAQLAAQSAAAGNQAEGGFMSDLFGGAGAAAPYLSSLF